jgi:hypothetical protein
MTTILLLVACLQGANLDADAGFKRDVFPDSWHRVTATLTYEGEPLESELRIIPRAHFCEPVVYRRPIALARKQRMRLGYDLYFTGQEFSLDVELVAGGKVLRSASIPLNFVRREAGRLLVVGTPPPFLVEAMAKLPPITMVRLAPELLPPNPLSLKCVDTILIPEPIDLEPGQEAALQAWVEQGGKLIFGAGRSTQLRLSPFWRDRCPLGSPQLATLSLRVKNADLAITIVRGPIVRGRATLQIGTDPFGIRAKEGRGEVVFLAAILDQPNLSRGIHAPSVLSELLDIPPPPPDPVAPKPGLRARAVEWLGRDSKAGIPLGTEDLMRRLLPPEFTVDWGPLGLGLGTVALYIVLMGPVEYLRLRRKGRLKTGWRSFAVLVVLFGGLLLLWGEVMVPRRSKGVLVTLRDEHRVQTFGALRPIRGGVYAFETAGAASAIAPSRVYGSTEPPDLFTVQLPGAVDVPIPPGASRLFVSSRPVEESDGVLLAAWAGPRKDAVTVKNSAAYPLNECWLVSKDTVWRLRGLPAGFEGTLPLAEPQEFQKWARRQRKPQENEWLGADPSSLVEPSRTGLVLSFHAALHGAWTDGRHRRRPQMRDLDWSPLLESGEAVLIGSFDRNLSGIRPRPEVPVETFGWARVPVREASR